MIIGILKEPDFEHRVALLPEAVKTLINLKTEVLVEKNAGLNSFADNSEYEEVGAKVVDEKKVINDSDLLLIINPPSKEQLTKLKKEQVVISVFNPLVNKEIVDHFLKSDQTTFSMDLIPRTTRGQAMDILSSMATIADTNWHYIVLEYDATDFNLYVDGVIDGAIVNSPMGETWSVSADNLLLGSDKDGSNLFSGTIDELRLYNRAVSAGLVSQHYGSGTPDYDTLDAAETQLAENWNVTVTPVNVNTIGNAFTSTGVTIVADAIPSLESVLLCIQHGDLVATPGVGN